MLEQANLCVKTKIVDMIDGIEWKWPIDFNDRFGEVTNVPVPNLVENVNDKTVWVDKKEDAVFKWIVDIVRLKLMGLSLKVTSDVEKVASIWGLVIRSDVYYKKMVDELIKSSYL
nr:RNA-directed DNA polymerase, eukaryota, reverse transcriptase zinc-binding domain protein [Tanacetum cinerariifolium]